MSDSLMRAPSAISASLGLGPSRFRGGGAPPAMSSSRFASRSSLGTSKEVSANSSCLLLLRTSWSSRCRPFLAASFFSSSATAYALSRLPAMPIVTWTICTPLRLTATMPDLRLTSALTASATEPLPSRPVSTFALGGGGGASSPSSTSSFLSGSAAPTPTSHRLLRSPSLGRQMSTQTISIFTQVSPRFLTPRIACLMASYFSSTLVFASLTRGQRSLAKSIKRWLRKTMLRMRFASSSFNIRSGIIRKQPVCSALPVVDLNLAMSFSILEPGAKPFDRFCQKALVVRCGIWTSWKRSILQWQRNKNIATNLW
mmetsp:Transcript_75786/g.214719  ORF Transcript_75786/g.214719 Transcript_75786/m.214719 type:complete len:314 (-) Transcript_75786:543-1484(-)